MTTELNILVVDDDRDHADSLADLFALEGHNVSVAYNGTDAISAFTNNDFDIAFMDVLMPDMNGVESFLKIKKIRPDAQVIMMTGYSVDQLLRQAADNGAVGVLHKPLDPKSILEMLEGLDRSGIILVAQADAKLGPSIHRTMLDRGWSCAMLTDENTVLTDVIEQNFDALILDLGVPLIDCLGIYKSIKATDIDVPTIMITDATGESACDLANGNDLAFSGVLTKPFELDDLLAKLPSLAKNCNRPEINTAPATRATTNA